MNIGIDGYFMAGKKTGMGVMLFNLLINLSEGFTLKNNINLYLPEALAENENNLLKEANINIKVLPKKIFPVWEQMVLKDVIKKDGIEVFWFPFNTACLAKSCKKIITVHDIIYMRGSWLSPKTLYKKLGMLYRRLVVPRAIKVADFLITVSIYSENELLEEFRKLPKVKIVYNAVAFNNDRLEASQWNEFKNLNKINKKYILAPGSLEKRKNVLSVIKAYNKLPDNIRDEYNLVLYGFKGWESSDEKRYIESNGIKGVVVLGYISDKELSSLYANADIFVFASKYEGFGIPVIESMYFGTPVITSDVTCLPEVASDAALYVNPSDIEDITSKMQVLLTDKEMRETLIKKGYENIKRFEWRRSSQMVENIFNELS